MSHSNAGQLSAVDTFRSMHLSDCFVLPNPWDIGTAVYLRYLGYRALATTSAGFAFSRGLPDDVSVIPRDLMLAHIREIASATTLPVNADFQNGYADTPEGVAANVRRCVATGVAGLSIEDSTGNVATPLYNDKLAIERIRAAREAIDSSGIPVVLTARCEAWLVGHPEAKRVAVERLVAFAEAGADCLYAPGVSDPEDIRSIVDAVAPKPVNVLVSRPGLTVSQLTELGVRRISVGSAFARVAWQAFIVSAKSIATSGSFESLAESASFVDLNEVFRRVENSL